MYMQILISNAVMSYTVMYSLKSNAVMAYAILERPSRSSWRDTWRHIRCLQFIYVVYSSWRNTWRHICCPQFMKRYMETCTLSGRHTSTQFTLSWSQYTLSPKLHSLESLHAANVMPETSAALNWIRWNHYTLPMWCLEQLLHSVNKGSIHSHEDTLTHSSWIRYSTLLMLLQVVHMYIRCSCYAQRYPYAVIKVWGHYKFL